MTQSNEPISFSWVVEPYRILAVLQPKCASSSLLWGLSELSGNDPQARLRRSVIDTATLEQAIHDPWVHRLPGLDAVSAPVRRSALESPDWMRLAVTRNPYARLYSAWENRVFLPYPGAAHDLLAASADVMVGDQLDVGESFRQFVAHLEDDPGLADRDIHFQQQVECLRPDAIAYTDLVDVGGVTGLGEEISRRAGKPFSLPRSNEGLGISWRSMFDDASARWVEKYYGEDFDRFGYEREHFSGCPGDHLLSPSAVRLVGSVRQRDARIEAFGEEGRRSHLSRMATISLRRRVRAANTRMRRSP